jgi:hypothetical protein
MADVSSGWGRLTWGQANWNDSTVYATGWGAKSWNDGAWGELHNVLLTLSGLEITSSLGSPTTTQITYAALTGQSITASLGTPTLTYDFIFTLSDSLLGTLSQGVISINDGADHTQGLGTQLITGTLNSSGMSHSMTYAVTGYSSTMSIGTLTFTETELIGITGLAITGSLGTLGTIDDMRIGLSGQAITGSLGSLASIDPMQIGLTGYSITASLASSNVSPLGYQDISIAGNTSYSGASITGNTSYSNVDITGNTSYTDVDVA